MTSKTKETGAGFYGLGIAPKLLATLDAMKFTTPTPIQKQAIPVACEGKDMVGIAQTGTGKTIAFAIPMLQSLAGKSGKGLVLVPTRELAIQVNGVFEQFSPQMNMRTAVLIGGEPIKRQITELRKNPRVIIATPGRLIDHLCQRTVKLNDVCILVLDEADRMLDMGFAPQIEQILKSVPAQRQTMLFSATMPEAIMKIAGAYMKLPIRIEVARSGTAAEKVIQEVYVVHKATKYDLLAKLLDKYWGSVLLFSRTKHNARKIARAICDMGHSAAEIHSNRTLNQRREALEGFKSGKYRVLVATDIAARGIDVTGIELVINYDLPDDDENYVHRIGRTGRAGHEGRAISFATPEQGGDVRNIERLMRMELPIVTHPDIPAAQFSAHALPSSRGRGGGGQRRNSGGRRPHSAGTSGQTSPAGEIQSIGGQRRTLKGRPPMRKRKIGSRRS
ncbi:MAG: DEAD/DEAH box helicase [Elusimicrobiaceae bacterium]